MATEKLQALLFTQNTLLVAVADAVLKVEDVDRKAVRRLLEDRAAQTRNTPMSEETRSLFDVAISRVIAEYAPPDGSGPESPQDPAPKRPDWFRGIVG